MRMKKKERAVERRSTKRSLYKELGIGKGDFAKAKQMGFLVEKVITAEERKKAIETTIDILERMEKDGGKGMKGIRMAIDKKLEENHSSFLPPPSSSIDAIPEFINGFNDITKELYKQICENESARKLYRIINKENKSNFKDILEIFSKIVAETMNGSYDNLGQTLPKVRDNLFRLILIQVMFKKENKLNEIRYFLHQNVDPNTVVLQAEKISAAQAVTYANNLDMITLLVDSKANIQCADKDLKTPLHVAAEHCGEPMIQYLLEKKAVIDAPTDDGNSPLIITAHKFNFEAEKSLLAHKADPNHENKAGETPLLSFFIRIRPEDRQSVSMAKQGIQLLLDAKANLNHVIKESPFPSPSTSHSALLYQGILN